MALRSYCIAVVLLVITSVISEELRERSKRSCSADMVVNLNDETCRRCDSRDTDKLATCCFQMNKCARGCADCQYHNRHHPKYGHTRCTRNELSFADDCLFRTCMKEHSCNPNILRKRSGRHDRDSYIKNKVSPRKSFIDLIRRYLGRYEEDHWYY